MFEHERGSAAVTPGPVAPSADLAASPGPVALVAAMSVDPVRLSDTALLDVLEGLEQTLSMAAAVRARLIAEYASRAPLDPVGFEQQQDMDWHREQLAVRCRTSCHEADVRCRASVDLITRLPLTFEALTAGSLPWAQAVTLARETRDLLPDESSAVERIVLADPRAISVRQVMFATRAAVELIRPSRAAEAQELAHEISSVQFWPHDDGTTDLHARLTTDTAAIVAAALEPLAVREGGDDDRTAEQRRADALVRLALTGPSRTGFGSASGPGSTGSRNGTGRADVRLTLLARTDPVHNRFGGCGLAAGSIDGTPITTDVLRRLTCDATVHVHPVDPDGTIGAEQATQCVPGSAMRRRLEARDQGCAFPGCHTPARHCHAHHIRHWADGGPTIDQNMILTCSRHHHLLHDGGWNLTGPPTDLTWTAPDGRRYEHPCATADIPHWPKDLAMVAAASAPPL
jgi:hypothetical protein